MILVNLLAILVRIPVNLLVKLAKLGVRGAIGAPGPGNTLGRGSYYDGNNNAPNTWGGYETTDGTMMRLMRLLWDYLLGILLDLLGVLLGISPDVLEYYWNTTENSTRILLGITLVTIS